MSGFTQVAANIRRAPVLPDDGVVDRRALLAIPQNCRLALVRKANACDFAAGFFRRFKSLTRNLQRRLPDILRIMFNPSVGRVMLREFFLRHGDGSTGAVKRNRPARCRALIDGENIGRFKFAHLPIRSSSDYLGTSAHVI